MGSTGTTACCSGPATESQSWEKSCSSSPDQQPLEYARTASAAAAFTESWVVSERAVSGITETFFRPYATVKLRRHSPGSIEGAVVGRE